MLLWLFRVFDIIKPFSIDRLECICKRHKNTIALGIMIDDVIAAVMAAGIKLTF
jgi:phosphatidylglycerophosphatase A